METINSTIMKVLDVQAKETKKGNYFLKFKFELKDGVKASLTAFMDSYSPNEIQNLLKDLKFVGNQEDFLLEEPTDRVKNFELDFSSSVGVVVTEETFKTEDGKTIEWYKVRKVGDSFELKEKPNNQIKDKQRFLKSFGSSNTTDDSTPF